MPNRIMITFLSPHSVRDRFDAVCRALGKTRTQALVELMDEHALRSFEAIANRADMLREVDEVLRAIKCSENRMIDSESMYGYNHPPSLILSNYDIHEDIDLQF